MSTSKQAESISPYFGAVRGADRDGRVHARAHPQEVERLLKKHLFVVQAEPGTTRLKTRAVTALVLMGFLAHLLSVRIPIKSATYSDRKPATRSD